MIFTFEELKGYEESQVRRLAEYMAIEHEGENIDDVIKKILSSLPKDPYQLYEEPNRSVRVQRIYESQEGV